MQDCRVSREIFKQMFIVISTDGSETRPTFQLLFMPTDSDFSATFSKGDGALLLGCYPSVRKHRLIV
jgi:hypothetical protein